MTISLSAIIGMRARVISLRARFASDTSGATALEYALIGAFTSIAIIAGLTLLGSSVNAEWNYVSNVVTTAMSR